MRLQTLPSARTFYYLVDKLPTQVAVNDDGTKLAEMYIPGLGFSKTHATYVEFEGYPISHDEFKEIIISISTMPKH